jgi:hypothetical protein
MTSNGTTWTSAPATGTGTVNSGTAYQLAYYAASGTAVSTLGSLGTNGQVLTSGGAGVAPTWTTISAGSQATATALGTVYARQTTGGGTPYLTAFGYNAGVSVTGASNVAIGTQALQATNTGTNNTAVGYQSAYSNTIGFKQVAIGNQALYSNNTSGGNSWVAIGAEAAWSFNSSGSNQAQVYIGASAGYYNVTGIDNTYVGGYAGYQATGSYNTAVGSGALSVVTASSSGSNNTALGYRSLYANINGGNNVSVGYLALSTASAGSNNCVMGDSAAVSATGNYNTCVGGASGSGLSTGIMNAFFGYQAGAGGYGAPAFTTGNYNVSIGNTTGCSAGSVTSSLVISSGLATVDKGTSTAFVNGNGGGTYNGANSATWAVTSDRRLKKNIVDNNVGLEKVVQIQVRNFEYRTENEVTELPKHSVIKKEGVQLGAIAQEIQEILPDCVKTESTGVMSIDSDNLMWHLINAVKELNAKVMNLETRLEV